MWPKALPSARLLSGFANRGWFKMLYALAPMANVSPLSVIRKFFLMVISMSKYPGPWNWFREMLPKAPKLSNDGGFSLNWLLFRHVMSTLQLGIEPPRKNGITTPTESFLTTEPVKFESTTL